MTRHARLIFEGQFVNIKLEGEITLETVSIGPLTVRERSMIFADRIYYAGKSYNAMYFDSIEFL